jgi:hypothetical protein
LKGSVPCTPLQAGNPVGPRVGELPGEIADPV